MKESLSALRDKLEKLLGPGRVRIEEPLAKHCNWRVGGPADLFITAQTREELVDAVRTAHSTGVPVTILGFGANILVSDLGIRGLIILNRAFGIQLESDHIIAVDSGTNMAVLARHAAKKHIAGLEFLIGIPGTVGAAVAVNAGTRTKWISEIVQETEILDRNSQLSFLKPSELDFSYRHSRLKTTGEIVISVRLRGHAGQRTEIEKRMRDELQVRKNQPTGPSTGSVFTNPAGDFAGRLIEASGLKGFSIGGAQVSEMHANFIMNSGGATAKDIRELITLVKTQVKERFSIELQEEIRYLGQWSQLPT